MHVPAIRRTIDRRILVNYRLDPSAASRVLPAEFRPKLLRGYAIAGICLIRLKHMRPAWLRLPIGAGSENAAHRIAVEWQQNDGIHEGVFIPRRDSNSRFNQLVGGRFFPGFHHHARFDINETVDRINVGFESDDRTASVRIAARTAEALPNDSIFTTLDEASRFFEAGAIGYSATRDVSRFDGLELRCTRWSIHPLAVDAVRSSYFENESMLPKGSVQFDCALLMRDIDHEWHSKEQICCA
jgi:hypothetical protein